MSTKENASETFTQSVDYLRSVALESHGLGDSAEAAQQISEAVVRYQSNKCKPTFGKKLDYQRDKYKKLLDTIISLNSQLTALFKEDLLIEPLLCARFADEEKLAALLEETPVNWGLNSAGASDDLAQQPDISPDLLLEVIRDDFVELLKALKTRETELLSIKSSLDNEGKQRGRPTGSGHESLIQDLEILFQHYTGTQHKRWNRETAPENDDSKKHSDFIKFVKLVFKEAELKSSVNIPEMVRRNHALRVSKADQNRDYRQELEVRAMMLRGRLRDDTSVLAALSPDAMDYQTFLANRPRGK